jgi:hypothetical protein
MIRANRHEDVEILARYADVPVINGLTDKEHPCQVLADLLTVMEAFKLKNTAGLKKLRIAYVGDGNNMAQSWMLAAALLGFNSPSPAPAATNPIKSFQIQALVLSKRSGARVEVVHDPRKAVAGAHVVYTDVWTSMGQEAEAEKRRKIFRPYQVNDSLDGSRPSRKRWSSIVCRPIERRKSRRRCWKGLTRLFSAGGKPPARAKSGAPKIVGWTAEPIVIRSLGRDKPRVPATAFVHPAAEVIGHVTVGGRGFRLARRGSAGGHRAHCGRGTDRIFKTTPFSTRTMGSHGLWAET